MKKLLALVFLAMLFSVNAVAKEKESDNLDDLSIKENLINELLINMEDPKKDIINLKQSKPKEETKKEKLYQKGIASFYGERWNGRKTANGEIFDTEKLTAAHKYLPFGTKVKITNSKNGKSVIVRINDRGPYIKGRVIDLTKAAFRQIEDIQTGITKVKIEILGK